MNIQIGQNQFLIPPRVEQRYTFKFYFEVELLLTFFQFLYIC